MTFEEFQASRQWTDDVRVTMPDEGQYYDEQTPGWVYGGDAFIECTGSWDESQKARLVILHDTFIDTLEANERRLFDFFAAEGLV